MPANGFPAIVTPLNNLLGVRYELRQGASLRPALELVALEVHHARAFALLSGLGDAYHGAVPRREMVNCTRKASNGRLNTRFRRLLPNHLGRARLCGAVAHQERIPQGLSPLGSADTEQFDPSGQWDSNRARRGGVG